MHCMIIFTRLNYTANYNQIRIVGTYLHKAFFSEGDSLFKFKAKPSSSGIIATFSQPACMIIIFATKYLSSEQCGPWASCFSFAAQMPLFQNVGEDMQMMPHGLILGVMLKFFPFIWITDPTLLFLHADIFTLGKKLDMTMA